MPKPVYKGKVLELSPETQRRYHHLNQYNQYNHHQKQQQQQYSPTLSIADSDNGCKVQNLELVEEKSPIIIHGEAARREQPQHDDRKRGDSKTMTMQATNMSPEVMMTHKNNQDRKNENRVKAGSNIESVEYTTHKYMTTTIPPPLMSMTTKTTKSLKHQRSLRSSSGNSSCEKSIIDPLHSLLCETSPFDNNDDSNRNNTTPQQKQQQQQRRRRGMELTEYKKSLSMKAAGMNHHEQRRRSQEITITRRKIIQPNDHHDGDDDGESSPQPSRRIPQSRPIEIHSPTRTKRAAAVGANRRVTRQSMDETTTTPESIKKSKPALERDGMSPSRSNTQTPPPSRTRRSMAAMATRNQSSPAAVEIIATGTRRKMALEAHRRVTMQMGRDKTSPRTKKSKAAVAARRRCDSDDDDVADRDNKNEFELQRRNDRRSRRTTTTRQQRQATSLSPGLSTPIRITKSIRAKAGDNEDLDKTTMSPINDRRGRSYSIDSTMLSNVMTPNYKTTTTTPDGKNTPHSTTTTPISKSLENDNDDETTIISQSSARSQRYLMRMASKTESPSLEYCSLSLSPSRRKKRQRRRKEEEEEEVHSTTALKSGENDDDKEEDKRCEDGGKDEEEEEEMVDYSAATYEFIDETLDDDNDKEDDADPKDDCLMKDDGREVMNNNKDINESNKKDDEDEVVTQDFESNDDTKEDDADPKDECAMKDVEREVMNNEDINESNKNDDDEVVTQDYEPNDDTTAAAASKEMVAQEEAPAEDINQMSCEKIQNNNNSASEDATTKQTDDDECINNSSDDNNNVVNNHKPAVDVNQMSYVKNQNNNYSASEDATTKQTDDDDCINNSSDDNNDVDNDHNSSDDDDSSSSSSNPTSSSPLHPSPHLPTLPHLPRRLHYPQSKSIQSPTTLINPRHTSHPTHPTPLHYYQTLGQTHNPPGVTLHLLPPSPIFAHFELGRAYYSSVTVGSKTTYTVGDFVYRSSQSSRIKPTYDNMTRDMELTDGLPKCYRIIAIYQAMKSFRGVWNKLDFNKSKKKYLMPEDDIQKRGHVYLIVVPLQPKKLLVELDGKRSKKKFTREKKGKKRRRSSGGGGGKRGCGDEESSIVSEQPLPEEENDDVIQHDGEFVLDCEGKLHPDHLFMLPIWLGEFCTDNGASLIKINMRVRYHQVDDDGSLEDTLVTSTIDEEKAATRVSSSRRQSSPKTTTIPTFLIQSVSNIHRDEIDMAKHRDCQLLSPLNHHQGQLLSTCCPMELIRQFVPNDEWYEEFKAEQVQFVATDSEERDNTKDDECDDLPYVYNETSDDSDGFDEVSRKIMADNSDDSDSEDDDYDDDNNEADKASVVVIDDDNDETTTTTEDLTTLQDKYLLKLGKKPNHSEILPFVGITGPVYCGHTAKKQTDRHEAISHHQEASKWLKEMPQSLAPLFENKTKELSNLLENRTRHYKPLGEFVNMQEQKKRAAMVGVDGVVVSNTYQSFRQLAEEYREKLGYSEFRYPQGEVCISVMKGNDTVYIAPTGHGKSLCFAVPALHSRGIIIVIEPLKAIINNQIEKFQRMGKITVEKLHNSEESDDRLSRFRAERRLAQIANAIQRNEFNGPLIIFSVMELIMQPKVLVQIKRIATLNYLERFVLDEFDVAAEAADGFRGMYTKLLPTLRRECKDVPFSLLSATTNREDLIDILKGLEGGGGDGEDASGLMKKKPDCFIHDRPLSDSLMFMVERKETDAQVAERISHMLKSYSLQHSSTPKCICYCLTITNCDKMKSLLSSPPHNFTVESITRETPQRVEVLDRLRTGQTQIVCATKALGRGVDISDIRFVFHTHLPTSLSDYVQESGRAGRDLKISYCVLFYRPHDQLITEKVAKIKDNHARDGGEGCLKEEKLERAKEVLERVVRYATCADEMACRYAMLAGSITLMSEVFGVEQGGGGGGGNMACTPRARCDNCRLRYGESFDWAVVEENKTVVLGGKKMPVNLKCLDITSFTLAFLERCRSMIVESGGGIAENVAMNTFKTLAESSEFEHLKLGYMFLTNQKDKSLKMDLIRLLKSYKILKTVGHRDRQRIQEEANTAQVMKQMKERKVLFTIRYVRTFEEPTTMKQNDTVKVLATDDAKLCKSGAEKHLGKRDHSSLSLKDPLQSISSQVVCKRQRQQQQQSLHATNSTLTEDHVVNEPQFDNTWIDIREEIRTEIIKSFSDPKNHMACPYLKMPRFTIKWLPCLPFLVQYEIWRLHNENHLSEAQLIQDVSDKNDYDTWDWNNRHASCQFLNQVAETSHAFRQYEHLLRQRHPTIAATTTATPSVAIDTGSGSILHSTLYLSASYGNNDRKPQKLTLNPPEVAHDRRIYRKFGSHRFLEIQITNKTLITDFRALLDSTRPLWVCGRRYAFLWAKAKKTPQSYVLFAECGLGIRKGEEMSVGEVRDWCLPRVLNPELTVGKEEKRMKLCFSKTTPSGVLPPDTLELVDDIVSSTTGEVMTDGCGLVSKEALDFIWNAYETYRTKRDRIVLKEPQDDDIDENDDDNNDENDAKDDDNNDDTTAQPEGADTTTTTTVPPDPDVPCPYSSFQGRIGGFKGLWVLDPTLTGIKIICRDSQRKFDVPMRSMIDMTSICREKKTTRSALAFDDAYDTVDVCSWDKCPEEGKLQLRLLQILEHRGVSLEYFKKRVDEGTKWLDELNKGSSKALLEHVDMKYNSRSRLEKRGDDHDMFDDDLIYRMASVNLPRNEPAFSKMIEGMVRKEAESMRDKCKYPLKRCHHLRMIPDHTQTLLPNEVFVATRTFQRDVEAHTDILAMRSPIYFSGDLLKLKIVSLSTIAQRSADAIKFFCGLETGLVISTQGDRSVADCMSGGDFDGDKAWACWDKELVDQVSDYPHVNTSGKEFQIEKSDKENVLVKDATSKTRIYYAWHYRIHHNKLCDLSTYLDVVNDHFGVDSEESKAVGTQAFLQVDHPYHICRIKDKYRQIVERCPQPHWRSHKVKFQTYKSTKALGVLWDYMEEKVKSIHRSNDDKSSSSEMNPHIMSVIRSMESKDNNSELLRDLRHEMRSAQEEYNKKLYNYLTSLRGKSKSSSSSAGAPAKSACTTLTAASNEDMDQKVMPWMKKQHVYWRAKLIDSKDGEDAKIQAAAILYEQSRLLGDSKKVYGDDGKAYKFPWHVAQDYLTRIIGDGEQREKGLVGCSATIVRVNEGVIIGKRKKK